MTMPKLGYKLMTEEHGPRELVENAKRAEQLGFDFVAISDHFFPWVDAQGHAPFAWSVLGAVAAATERVGLATAVTCPAFRYHPAIVAQAAATMAVLSQGRFTLGLGSGELLNEHVVAPRWPSIGARQDMLCEAIDIIRTLFDGEKHTYRGEFFEVEEARLYDVPETRPKIVVAAGGRQAATLAGEMADGLIATEPNAKLIEAYREAGGRGPLYVELGLCYADSEETALDRVKELRAWSSLGWPVLSDLALPAGFEAATRHVHAEDLADSMPMGPDVERHLEAIQEHVDAGYDHIVLSQVGPDQEGFFRFFEKELAPRLRQKR